MNEETVGTRIRKRREELGLSMEEIGEAIGIHKSTIQRYETGVFKGIKTPTLRSLAKALDVSVDWLNGIEVAEKPQSPELEKMDFDVKLKVANLLIMARSRIFEETEEKQYLQFYTDYINSLALIMDQVQELHEEFYSNEELDSMSEDEFTVVKRKEFKECLNESVCIISEWFYNLPTLLAERKSLDDYLETHCNNKQFLKLYEKQKKKK